MTRIWVQVFVLNLLLVPCVFGDVLNLEQTIDRALNTDPRISELEKLVDVARATLDEAQGSDDLMVTINSFVGLSPGLTGGLSKDDNACETGAGCVNRRDRYTLEEGLSLWNYLDYRIIKPIYTFGKIEHFSAAARANIMVKEGDVRVRRGATVLQVKQAYFGHLAAANTHAFLIDMKSRVDASIETVEDWLEDDAGHVKKADLYALQTASGIAASFIAQANALKKISLDGLKVLTGIGLDGKLELADKRIRPLPLPESSLTELRQLALSNRPEMKQLEYGLKARRSLVAANKALSKPNIYAGFAGLISYSPGRDRLDNPHIYDPFNDWGGTPVIGMQWEWQGGVSSAKVSKSKAELAALIEKSSFARSGIPFQVAESFHNVHSYYDSVKSLEKGSRAARRWMISTYTDFDAGLEQAEKIVTAFQGYVLAYSGYLKTVYEYNMHVAQLDIVTGAYN